MQRLTPSQDTKRNSLAGLTLLELILACSILLILASAAMPLAQMTIRRQRESEMRRDLRELRNAIDRYKDAADKNQIQTAVGSQGYPPDLQTLVDGVTVQHERGIRAASAPPRWPGPAAQRNSVQPEHRLPRPAKMPVRQIPAACQVNRCPLHQARCDF